jgi:hypothetical protein
VKESRIVQISGKILIASNSNMVGLMNAQAIAESERPRGSRTAIRGVRFAALFSNAWADCESNVHLTTGEQKDEGPLSLR